MKVKNGLKLFSVALIVGILTYLAIAGTTIGNVTIPEIKGLNIPSAQDITPGIDIQGGVSATLEADLEDGKTASADELEQARTVIERRLDNEGILDRNVIVSSKGKGRIIVEIPWSKNVNKEDFKPSDIMNNIGQMARLTFQEVDPSKVDANGDYLPTGKIVLEGKNVQSAKLDTQDLRSIVLELDSVGKKNFAEATGRLVGKQIAIFMDDNMLSDPRVNEPITGGRAWITGQRSTEEASELAKLISAGRLPFKLEVKDVLSISPLLGMSALKIILYAGFVSLLIVFLFMIFFYRLPGLLANIALLGNVVMVVLALSLLGVTLTLPGIAGIILTIGMGVDANVIIFERIKEEMRNGKTLRAAIDVGFKRAFSAILDGNVTTLIAAIVLWKFGTGPIVGFAYTLSIGVLLNFITAITASRIMLKSIANMGFTKPWLYGVKEARTKKSFDFVGKRKIFFVLSSLVIVTGITFYIARDGFNYDIQFQGGTIIKMKMKDANFDVDKASQIAQETLGKNVTALQSSTLDTEGEDKQIDLLVLQISNKDTLSSEEMKKVEDAIIEEYGLDAKNAVVSEESVDPYISQELKTNALIATLIVSLLIVLYIWWRFRVMSGLSAGLMALLALLHDALIMLSVYTIFNIHVNESFIAAVLTILGYSMNDTIVIYDRIRENSGMLRKTSVSGLVNTSINDSLSRSINTTVTTLLCVITVYVFAAVYNVESIKQFSLPLIVGLASGAYSSIFVACPLWVMWKEHSQKSKAASDA